MVWTRIFTYDGSLYSKIPQTPVRTRAVLFQRCKGGGKWTTSTAGEDGGISQAPLQTQCKMQAEASEMLQRESRGQTPTVPAESGKTTRGLCSLHAPTRQSSGQQMSARSKPLGLCWHRKSRFPPSLLLQQQFFLSYSKLALKHSFNFQHTASSSLAVWLWHRGR